MAFVRANSSGWAVGDVLTSAQMNALDIDHTKALDKSVAGDAIAGTVTVSGGTSSIVVNGLNGIVANFSQGIESAVSGGIYPSVSNGVQSAVAQGIASVVANGISTSAASGISTQIAGGIASGVTGGISLTGGSSDWPTFSTPRVHTVKWPMWPGAAVSGTAWTALADGVGHALLTGSATTTPVTLTLPPMHNGATISGVRVYIQVGLPHSSVPAVFPSFDILRRSFTNSGVVPTDVSLFSGGPVHASAGSGALWYASSNEQSWAGTPNQNNTVDTTQYCYFMQLTDESGTGSQTSNVFYGMEIAYSNIVNMQFQ